MAIDSQSSSSSSSPTFQSSASSTSSSPSSSPSVSSTPAHASQASGQHENALDLLRGSVVGVLDSVVREYEPQIAQFTQNIAHQAVDRGVSFAQTAVQRVQKQSWMRLGLAAALGVGIVAVLGYEAAEATKEASARGGSSVH